ncbi:uncharacterized protein TNCV_2069541 [Trichonephila clavipes]|uniref:Uncharacterized protein n=1 Tax=Trichonephila clavipes TaxID=2585209 RepID=A0A8X7BE59_TRICX|nr:uncharacterized protein TNCV_2069541 [Trichonephila clavipes]
MKFSEGSMSFEMCATCSSEPTSPVHILECLGLTKQDLADDPLMVLDFFESGNAPEDEHEKQGKSRDSFYRLIQNVHLFLAFDIPNTNSVAQQPMRVRAYCAHPSICDHWVLKCMSRCPEQVVSRKRDPQCLSPQASFFFGTHLSTHCSRDERLSRPFPARE